MTLIILEHHPDGSVRELKEGEEFIWQPNPFFGFKILNKKPECQYTWEFTMGSPFPAKHKSITSV